MRFLLKSVTLNTDVPANMAFTHNNEQSIIPEPENRPQQIQIDFNVSSWNAAVGSEVRENGVSYRVIDSEVYNDRGEKITPDAENRYQLGNNKYMVVAEKLVLVEEKFVAAPGPVAAETSPPENFGEKVKKFFDPGSYDLELETATAGKIDNNDEEKTVPGAAYVRGEVEGPFRFNFTFISPFGPRSDITPWSFLDSFTLGFGDPNKLALDIGNIRSRLNEPSLYNLADLTSNFNPVFLDSTLFDPIRTVGVRGSLGLNDIGIEAAWHESRAGRDPEADFASRMNDLFSGNMAAEFAMYVPIANRLFITPTLNYDNYNDTPENQVQRFDARVDMHGLLGGLKRPDKNKWEFGYAVFAGYTTANQTNAATGYSFKTVPLLIGESNKDQYAALGLRPGDPVPKLENGELIPVRIDNSNKDKYTEFGLGVGDVAPRLDLDGNIIPVEIFNSEHPDYPALKDDFWSGDPAPIISNNGDIAWKYDGNGQRILQKNSDGTVRKSPNGQDMYEYYYDYEQEHEIETEEVPDNPIMGKTDFIPWGINGGFHLMFSGNDIVYLGKNNTLPLSFNIGVGFTAAYLNRYKGYNKGTGREYGGTNSDLQFTIPLRADVTLGLKEWLFLTLGATGKFDLMQTSSVPEGGSDYSRDPWDNKFSWDAYAGITLRY